MYISPEMQAYADGYHDGRMEYDYTAYEIQELNQFYMQGYENGLEERTEQDERG